MEVAPRNGVHASMVDRPPSHHPPSLTSRCSSCGARLREEATPCARGMDRPPSHHPPSLTSRCSSCGPRLWRRRRHARGPGPSAVVMRSRQASQCVGSSSTPSLPPLPHHGREHARVTGAAAPIRGRPLHPLSKGARARSRRRHGREGLSSRREHRLPSRMSTYTERGGRTRFRFGSGPAPIVRFVTSSRESQRFGLQHSAYRALCAADVASARLV